MNAEPQHTLRAARDQRVIRCRGARPARKETDAGGSFGVPFRRESFENALKILGLPPPNPANLLSVQ